MFAGILQGILLYVQFDVDILDLYSSGYSDTIILKWRSWSDFCINNSPE